MKSYVLHLIRCFPCQGNLEGRYMGRAESPLAESAIPELLRLKREHPYPAAGAFFAAPHTRCVDTLRLLYPWAQPEVALQLAECDFGEWDGKTAQELRDEPGFAAWLAGGGQTAPPGGESGPVFAQRARAGFELVVQNLLAKGQTSAVLVATAGVLTTILASYGLPQAAPTDWLCAPGYGYTCRITPNLWMRSRVMEVADTLPPQPQRPAQEDSAPLFLDLEQEGEGDGGQTPPA